MNTDSPFQEPSVLRLSRPADVLAYLPYRFGFVPTESLAVLAVLEDEPRRVTIGMAARLDIADLARPAVLRQAMAGLCEQMERDATVAVLTVLYSDVPHEGILDDGGAAARVLRSWLARFPYADPEATFLVTPRTFRCLECAEPPCCPVDGHPVERLSQTSVAAAMVLAGEALVPTRDALACPRDAIADRAERAARAAARERRSMRTRTAQQQGRWRTAMLDRYGCALGEAADRSPRWDPDPGELGRLSAALSDPDLRDAVVVWSLGGRRLAPGSPSVLDAFEGLLTGASVPPGADHLDAAEAVLTEVARHAPPARSGYPLAVLAWLAWWRGEGARADVLRRQSLDADPLNSLARLLTQVLENGVRPGWALPGSTVPTPAR